MKFIFLPVQCPSCHKTSIVSLQAVSTKSALNENKRISLQCSFDMTQWNASDMTRMRLSKLLEEKQLVEQISWLRFKDEISASAER